MGVLIRKAGTRRTHFPLYNKIHVRVNSDTTDRQDEQSVAYLLGVVATCESSPGLTTQ